MAYQQEIGKPFIPPYRINAALQLIVATSSTFIMFHMARISMYMVHIEKTEVFNRLFPNFALSSLVNFKEKAWTILTYGWIHEGFWDWFTNMIWLYCFGAILQYLSSYRQLIPLFVYALLAGGIFYVCSQYIPIAALHPSPGQYFFGAQAGVMAFAGASLTLDPKYKLQLTPQFGIPLPLIVGIYFLVNIVAYIPTHYTVLMLCLGGFVTGVVFSLFLKKGYQPTQWIYTIMDALNKATTPDEKKLTQKKSTKRIEILRTMYEPKQGISQSLIDSLLDKINEHGYGSLTKTERNTLERASKD